MGAGEPVQAQVRHAVRTSLSDLAPGQVVLAAVSGGADSLALAAALAAEAPGMGLLAGSVTVDHGLQPGSAEQAERAAGQCSALGLAPARVVAVEIAAQGEGVEAAARAARHVALAQAADELGAAAIVLGHTRDDQAEQVLLGLVRGSGARSLAGMPAARGLLRRPLLGITRAQTEAACAAWELQPWHDPMNNDRAYTRVRARQALASLEADLGPGVGAALARSADLLRADADYLDQAAQAARAQLGPPAPALVPAPQPEPEAAPTPVPAPQPVPVPAPAPLPAPLPAQQLAELPPAIRTRLWRLLLVEAGCPPGALTSAHIRACDALLTHWHGQGALALPGPTRVQREQDLITIVGPAGRSAWVSPDDRQQ